jgi:hypothetical protein
MLHRLLLPILLLAPGGLALSAEATIPREIDPDGEMHGVRFGATDAQVRAKLGAPTGSLRLSDTRQALFYGRSHAFVFRKSRLVELHVTHSLFDWDLSQNMEEHPLLNSERWTLKPGIENEMTFPEVARLLNKPNARPDFRYRYETEKAIVELSFSGRSSDKGSPDQFTLRSFSIKSLALQF